LSLLHNRREYPAHHALENKYQYRFVLFAQTRQCDWLVTPLIFSVLVMILVLLIQISVN
jgi:hypothetical protein